MLISKLILCADHVIVDEQTKNISAVNILEEISAIKFPFAYPKISAINWIKREADDPRKTDIKLIIKNNDNLIFDADYSIDFGESMMNRFIYNLVGIKIKLAGTLNFNYEHDGNPLGFYEIKINKIGTSD